MKPALLPGVGGPRAQLALDDCRTQAINIRGGDSSDADAFMVKYLNWARDSADRLSALIADGDVTRLFLTPTYWAMLTVPASGGVLRRTVQAELDVRVVALKSAVDWLASQAERWSFGFGPLVVLDTSVFIEHKAEFPESLALIEDVVVPRHEDGPVNAGSPVQFVVPLQVVDELDRAKADRSRGRARTALARINEAFEDPTSRATFPDLREGTHVHLMMDEPGHTRMTVEDDEIVDRAVFLNSVSGLSGVGIASMDTGMAMRARMAGLRAFLLEERRPENKISHPARSSGATRG